MKKIKLEKGLQLNKEILTKLEDSQMASIKGQGSSGPKCTCNKNSCIEEKKDLALADW